MTCTLYVVLKLGVDIEINNIINILNVTIQNLVVTKLGFIGKLG